MKTPKRRALAACCFATLAMLALVIGPSAQTALFYWDEPRAISRGEASMPLSASGGGTSAFAWQESEENGGGMVSIWISLWASLRGGPYERRARIAGPYVYPRAESLPSIYSLAVGTDGAILLAALKDERSVELSLSRDGGASFVRSVVDVSALGGVTPRVFSRGADGYILFVSSGSAERQVISYALSEDGLAWGQWKNVFEGREVPGFSYLPSYARRGETGREHLAFQVFQGANTASGATRQSFQIYTTYSDDGAASWSAPLRVTSFNELATSVSQPLPDFWDNQRPQLYYHGGELHLAWERKAVSGGSQAQIYHLRLSDTGAVPSLQFGARVSDGSGSCSAPVLIETGGVLSCLWFDTKEGRPKPRLARNVRTGIWQPTEIGYDFRADALFPRIIDDGGKYRLAWLERAPSGTQQVRILEPDERVAAAIPQAANFTPGRRSASSVARFRWTAPADTSGIAGYSYLLSRDPGDVPPERIDPALASRSADVPVLEDGEWHFILRTRDNAGNWSAPASLAFIRDTTPPEAPLVGSPMPDERGFLSSNTFTLEWPEPALDEGETVAGYTWTIQYLGPIDAPLPALASWDPEAARAAASRYKLDDPPARNLGAARRSSYDNLENGFYVFSLAAIDGVGNISAPSRFFFRLNRFRPYTAVYDLTRVRDDLGAYSVSLRGRGFSAEGRISTIRVDRDGVEPWDAEYRLADGAYAIVGDTEIRGLALGDLEEGSYRLILVHDRRGPFLAPQRLTIDETGTVKFGDYRAPTYEPSWTVPRPAPLAFSVTDAMLALFMLFCVIGILVSTRFAAGALAEGRAVALEVRALLEGDLMPQAKKEAARAARRRGLGLRIKFSLFTSAIVFFVIALVAVPVFLSVTGTQERTLLSGLREKANVILDNLAAGAANYLPNEVNGLADLSLLPARIETVEEAVYATITGYKLSETGATRSTGADYVWASNDPDLASKIDLPAFEAGLALLNDEFSAKAALLATELDTEARSALAELKASWDALNAEGLRLALAGDPRAGEVGTRANAVKARITEVLFALSARFGSEVDNTEPPFPTQALSRERDRYLFYKPILYAMPKDDLYFRGLVRLEISTEKIAREIDRARGELILIVGIAAAVALGAGIIGALLLALLIIRPIRLLARGVEKIRDTEDKEELEGHSIAVKTHDEIADLAATVNQMIAGLVSAAKAAKELTVGKEIQKRFMTLATDTSGRKLTTVHAEDTRVELFGYYEGAKGVSGDYFDYIKLDETHYAIIKCDVAGKGVSASLIMVEVATLFLNHFRGWKPSDKPEALQQLVIRINDLIEERGFSGRFAAFTLALMDTASGSVRFCNAGDNILHYWDESARQKLQKTIPSGPSAGSFPSDLVLMGKGFPMHQERFDAGDIIFFYTDGLEEAKRHFRDSSFKVIACAEPGLERNAPHGSHSVGQESEELGPERIKEIVEAIKAKGRYRLRKWHNPMGEDEALDFDFSSCAGSLEDCVIGLMAVEKVFRLYPDPSAGEQDKVLVDAKIDAFLEAHFSGYRIYCKKKAPKTDQPEYVVWAGIKEDDQYDDLTLLAVRRK